MRRSCFFCRCFGLFVSLLVVGGGRRGEEEVLPGVAAPPLPPLPVPEQERRRVLDGNRRRRQPRRGRARERGHDERREIEGDGVCVFVLASEGDIRERKESGKKGKRTERGESVAPSSPTPLPSPLVARNRLALALGAAALLAVLPLVEHPLSLQQRGRGAAALLLLLLVAEEAKRQGRIAVFFARLQTRTEK